MPTNTMVENIVAIELAYVNTRHPDFYKDMANISSMLKSPDLETERMNQGRGRSSGDRERSVKSVRPHSVHFPQQNGEESDKENTGGRGRGGRSAGDSQVITASTWLSNILPAPKEDGREQSPSPQHKAISQVVEGDTALTPSNAMSPVKPVNLLPEIPNSQTMGRKLNDREQRDCEVIERLIKSYFYLVRKMIQDSVPKAVMHFMVNFVKDNLQSELVSSLYKAEQIESLLSESEHIGQRRKEAAEMLEALQKASQIISEIRETHVW